MNALVSQPNFHAQLPAFLRSASFFSSESGLTAGISGGQPPTIAFSGKSFKLRDANGEELFVQQMHLDVIVVGGNRFVSKAYYGDANGPTKYDPNNSGPPDCWSDNGQTPSSQCSSPQATSCAGCKWNAFGSRISDTGSMVKACGDAKKLAVVLATPVQAMVNNAATVVQPFQGVYLLKLPAMSMRPWKDYAETVEKAGVPVKAGVVTKLQFDPTVTFPKVMFAPLAMVTEEQYRQFEKLVDSDAVKLAVGANDVPLFSGTATQYEATRVAVLNPGTAGQQPSVSAQPAPAFTPTPTAPLAAAPASTTFPQATPPAPTPEASAPTARRRRASAPASVAQLQPQAQQIFTPAAQASGFAPPTGGFAAPQSGVQNGVIQTPQASDAGLDAQLDALFS